MDVFNALWNDPEQRKRPPDDNFQPFTMEEWFAYSSTHKILSGSLKCPLPPDIECPKKFAAPSGERSQNVDKNVRHPKPTQKPSCSSQSSMVQSTEGKAVSNSVTKTYVPGLVKFPMFTRVSSLSSGEQQDCLMLLQKFDGKNLEDLSTTERTEYQLFQSLYNRVKDEQEEFLQCAKECWPEYVVRTSRMRGDPHNFILQLWKDRVSRALGFYSKGYRRIKMLPLSRNDRKHIQLIFTRHLLKIGKVPLIILPKFDKPFRVASSLIKLRSSALFNIPPLQLAGSLHKIPVSQDPNAERLARLHGADVVISSSGFKCLLNNFDENKHPNPSGVGKSWILPIIVKEYRSFDKGKPVTRTSVFIDKMLPPPQITNFEKCSWYQKRALSAAVVQQHHPGGIEFEIKGAEFLTRHDSEETTQKEDHSQSVSIDINKEGEPTISLVSSVRKLEDGTACTEKESSSMNDTVNQVCNSTTNSDSEDCEDSSDSLTIALSDEETAINTVDGTRSSASKILEYDVAIKTKHEKETIVPGIVENNFSCENELNTTHAGTCVSNTSHEEPQKSAANQDTENVLGSSNSCWKHVTQKSPTVKMVDGVALPLKLTNVTYNLWSLQPQLPENHNNPDQATKNINLLIRSRIDGCEVLQPNSYQSLCIATKPEFQLEFGAGALSLDELTRQWAKLIIQPDTELARVRVNVHSSEMVKVERRTKKGVEQEAQTLHHEDLKDTLANLYGVLSDLMNLPCGEYVLSHSPEMGLGAELMVKTLDGEAEDMNLLVEYKASPVVKECQAPWQPLDPTVIMPKNIFFRQMPCTFQALRGPKALPKKNKPPVKKAITVNTYKKKKKAKKKKNKSGGMKGNKPQAE